jgi:hypothetical protein
MNLRQVVLIICAILLLGAAGFVGYVYWELRDSPMSDGHHPTAGSFAAKVTEYERLIQREIPTGSSATQVDKFLTAHQIEHVSLQEIAELGRGPDFEKLRFPGKSQLLKITYARVRKAEHAGVIEWSLLFNFYFDENDRLVTHTLDWAGTGP